MDIQQASRLLNVAGKQTSYQNNCIKEKVDLYENYYQLEKDRDKWKYGLFMVERQNNPYFKVQKEFDKETEGAKYFFLDRLSSFYFSTKIKPFMNSHSELDIGGSNFDENKLYKAMSILSIPSSLLVTSKSKIKNRAIMITNEDATNSIVSLVDNSGNIIKSTIPISKQRALLIAFKKVYMLYLFENEVTKLMQSENIQGDFSDNDINIFLS